MIQWWQILLLTLYSAYQICDELTIVSSAGSPVFAGFITGLVMGDLKTGLFIGASLQLTVLGVGTFGGASRIDATSGAVLATAFSVAQGIKPEIAISTIAVPVAGDCLPLRWIVSGCDALGLLLPDSLHGDADCFDWTSTRWHCSHAYW